MFTSRTLKALSPVNDDNWGGSIFSDFDDLMNSNRFDFTQSFPAMNIYLDQDDDGFYLEMALVGYSKDYLSVETNGYELSISAKVPEKKEEESKHYFKQRIQAKDFTRVYKIPDGYDTEKIEVKFADGLLTVYIPSKKEKDISRKIAIK